MYIIQIRFAIENLLFLTTIIQFEDFLFDNNIIDESIGHILSHNKIILPDIVPKSSIFIKKENMNINEQINEIYIAIFDKYIKRYSAELEINISYIIMEELTKHYNYVKENDKLLSIEKWWKDIQRTSLEVYGMLKDSHSRFKYYTTQVEM